MVLRHTPNPTDTANRSALHPSDPHYPASSGGGPATNGAAPRSDLTSEMLDLILGKSDSLSMKEKMAYALDTSSPLDGRVEALDDFEMLIELIDNANNMPVLKLWQPLISLFGDPEPPIVEHACWIVGTAVQNNLKAQAALYIHGAFPKILGVLDGGGAGAGPGPSTVRSRATYALSGALKHWPLASSALTAEGDRGYAVLRHGVVDDDVSVQRKMAFLVGTLVMQDGEKYEGELPPEVQNLLEESLRQPVGGLVDGLKAHGVLAALLEGLQKGDDVEQEENAMRALMDASKKGGLDETQKEALKRVWAGWGEEGQAERGFEGDVDDLMSGAAS